MGAQVLAGGLQRHDQHLALHRAEQRAHLALLDPQQVLEGEHRLAHPGRDRRVLLADPIEVVATDAAGAPLAAQARFATTVDAVEFTAAGQRLHLGHARVSPGAVTTIAREGIDL